MIRHLAPLAAAALVTGGCSVGGGDDGRAAPAGVAVAERVQLPAKPAGVAAGEGAIWATDAEAGNLLKIDPGSARVAQTIHVGMAATAVAAGGGAVWVGDPVASEIVRVDPESGDVVARIPVTTPSELAFGLGSLWAIVSGQPSILRIDPATNEIVARVEVPGAASLAVGAGSVWTYSRSGSFQGAETALVRIDPERNAVAKRVEFEGFGGGAVAAGRRAVWMSVSSPDRNGIARVDSGTNEVLGLVPLKRTRSGTRALAVGPGSVWVVGGTHVTRIDPSRNRVAESVQVSRYGEPSPADPAYVDLGPVAPAADGIWVADPSSKRVVHVKRGG